MTALTVRADGYPLGHSDHETRRLMRQHQLYGPLTRRFLDQAGISRGMRVLDLGTGAGDVALLAAELVGPHGSVTGVDSNPAILETAASRIDAVGWTNVELVVGDVDEVSLDGRYDAVIGRWVLMYLPDPVATLRRAASLLRPGGLAAFHESDLTVPFRSHPPLPEHDRLAALSRPPLTDRVNGETGPTLWRTFRAAGFEDPHLVMETPIGAGAGFGGYQYLEDSLRSLADFLSRNGLDADLLGIDGLADRLRDEVVANDAVEMLAPVIGAWSRLP